MQDFFEQLKNDNIPQEIRITPLHREYERPAVNYREAFRYAGMPAAYYKGDSKGEDAQYIAKLKARCEKCGNKCDFEANIMHPCEEEKDEALNNLLDEMLRLADKELTYRISYCCLPLTFDEKGMPIFPFEHNSQDLTTNLNGCKGVLIFAATIGAGIDRLIRRYERVAPAKALMLQGLGAERVESLCDLFNDEVTKTAAEYGLKTHPRYSPGYGDMPLNVQPIVLDMVDAGKRLGITISDSCLMSPSKSVTAIIGIE